MNKAKDFLIGLWLFLLISITIIGCVTSKPDYSNIPLTNSGMPYQLPFGDYKDTRGIVHHETTHRWSVSEEWLYLSIRDIKSTESK